MDPIKGLWLLKTIKCITMSALFFIAPIISSVALLAIIVWKIIRENKVIKMADKNGQKIKKYRSSKLKGLEIEFTDQVDST